MIEIKYYICFKNHLITNKNLNFVSQLQNNFTVADKNVNIKMKDINQKINFILVQTKLKGKNQLKEKRLVPFDKCAEKKGGLKIMELSED